jgi:hypothetical protein
LDKDAARALDPALRESLAAEFAQDFVSALLPLGALVVDRIQEAAGVLFAKPSLALMPDHPRLGEFREDFAGVLGWIEIRADEAPDGGPGFAGSTDVKGSEPFLEDLEEDPWARPDSRAYLKARLIDALVGDWDRHPDQWRWAGFQEGDGTRFEPVPRDRDWALATLDGVKMWVSQVPWPHYVGFAHDYPSAFRLTWSGRVLDRRILPSLVWEDWASVVRELETALPDSVLEEAVRRLPDSHFEIVGPRLTDALKNRRDGLLGLARDFYLLQAEAVELRATDETERVVFQRLPGGDLRVTILQTGPDWDGRAPWYDRTFSASETKEVRVFLHGGDDEAQVQGAGSTPIDIVVVGGGGDDRFSVEEGTRGTGIRFFDDRGDNHFQGGPGTWVNESSWSDPHDWREDSHWAGTRDWGSRTIVVPSVLFAGDAGLFVGGSLIRTGYGFRQYPYQDLTRLTLAYGARTQKPHVEADVEFPLRGQRIMGRLHGLATGARVHRFYGFGNETSGTEPLERYEAFGAEYLIDGTVIVRLAPHFTGSLGAQFALKDPTRNLGTELADQAPYGFERFTSLALNAGLEWDGRDDPNWPRRGGTLHVAGSLFPQTGSVQDPFGKAEVSGSTYLTAEDLPFSPTLALQVRGQKVWGDFPYMEGATVGGSRSLRGFPEGRFLGDASLSAGSELRVHVGGLPKILPGSWGITVAGEVGRVWWQNEDSDLWRKSLGGGLWASIIDEFTLTLSMARSDEGTRFLYGGGGFHF